MGGLTNGQAYVVTLAAHTRVGYGPETASTAAVTPVAPTGSGDRAVPQPGRYQVVISWTAPARLTGGGCGSHSWVRRLHKAVNRPHFGAPDATVMTTTSTVTGLTNGSGIRRQSDCPDRCAEQRRTPSRPVFMTVPRRRPTSPSRRQCGDKRPDRLGWPSDGRWLPRHRDRGEGSVGRWRAHHQDRLPPTPYSADRTDDGKAYNGRVTSENLIRGIGSR